MPKSRAVRQTANPKTYEIFAKDWRNPDRSLEAHARSWGALHTLWKEELAGMLHPVLAVGQAVNRGRQGNGSALDIIDFVSSIAWAKGLSTGGLKPSNYRSTMRSGSNALNAVDDVNAWLGNIDCTGIGGGHPDANLSALPSSWREMAYNVAVGEAKTLDPNRIPEGGGTVIAGAYDMRTAKTYWGLSGDINSFDEVEVPLRSLLSDPSLEGSRLSFMCAEVSVCNLALKDGANLEDLVVVPINTKFHGRPKSVPNVEIVSSGQQHLMTFQMEGGDLSNSI